MPEFEIPQAFSNRQNAKAHDEAERDEQVVDQTMAVVPGTRAENQARLPSKLGWNCSTWVEIMPGLQVMIHLRNFQIRNRDSEVAIS